MNHKSPKLVTKDGNAWWLLENRPLGHLRRWPKVIFYRTATAVRFQPGLNRYPGSVIGAQVRVGYRCLGIVWGTPARYTRTGL